MRVGRFERSSQRPSPRLRTSGIPNGQRYCKVMRSSTIARRSSAGRSLSHSLAGPLPPSVRKKMTGSGRGAGIESCVSFSIHSARLSLEGLHGNYFQLADAPTKGLKQALDEASSGDIRRKSAEARTWLGRTSFLLARSIPAHLCLLPSAATLGGRRWYLKSASTH